MEKCSYWMGLSFLDKAGMNPSPSSICPFVRFDITLIFLISIKLL